MARFGENDEYEKSPGRLDQMTEPVAKFPADAKLTKEAECFLIEGADAKAPAVIDMFYAVSERPNKDGTPAKPRLPFFHARWHVSGQKAEPVAELDLVPVSETKVVVYFHGKPLADAKVQVKATEGEPQSLVSAADGSVEFASAKPGSYIFTTRNAEDKAGESGGKPYAILSHTCTLHWVKK